MARADGEKVTVKLRKSGWEVEISCLEDQLKQVIESALSSFSAAALEADLRVDRAHGEPTTKTCRGLIVELWQENWFADRRGLSDVHAEISRRGFNYDRTAVSHSLTDLVRENVLTREGVPRNYMYVQKKPYAMIAKTSEESEKRAQQQPVTTDTRAENR